MPDQRTELTKKNDSPEDKVPLENAPDEIKLAVDLIMLLEESQIDPQTILAALKIVTHDIEQRQQKCQSLPSGMAQR